MSRRWMVAGLVIVAVIAVAVPAVAGEFNGKPSSVQFLNLKRVQLKARKLSKRALRIANEALRKASVPGPAGPPGGSTAPKFAQNPGPVTGTDIDNYPADPGGPSVSVNVPQATNGPAGTGFIQVAAQAKVGDDGAAVGLFEDGSLMPNQGDICEVTVAGNIATPLFVSLDGFPDAIWGTPAQLGSFGEQCASANAAGPVTFETTPGNHTYELQYAPCGCTNDTTTLTDIKLWVTPLN
jgi:hypothetical protein